MTGNFSSLDSNGWTFNGATHNTSGYTYVGWQWKGGGAGVTNNDGSVTSTVSANPTAGFSIVTYTGTGANATVGHGLGIAPKMIIIKSRSNTLNWPVYHEGIGAAYYNTRLLLNTTGASAGASGAYWNGSPAGSTAFVLGTDTEANTLNATYVAYCFAPITGYSAFGSYTGNGSTDGPFVYLGFRPRWLMMKASSTTSNWELYDTTRDPYNICNAILYANTSGAEPGAATALDIDILSNGFKWREGGGQGNDSGVTYIYAAFAENPFTIARAR